MSGVIFIIFGIVIVPMFIMAIFLLNGKGAFLIAGYNTLSKYEKEKYDEKALCRFVGWLLIFISACMVLFPIGSYFEMEWLAYGGIAAMFAVTIGGVFYANTNNRFHKIVDLEGALVANENDNPKSSTAKTRIVAVTVILAVVFIAVGLLLYQGEKEPVVHIFDNSIQIKAMYGLNIDSFAITDISLIEKSMIDIGVGRRTNGYGGLGETLKGHFKSASLGETLLFVQSKSSPTIRIEREDKKDVYISFHNGEKTKRLYDEMIASISAK